MMDPNTGNPINGEEFHVPARDTRGQSERVWFKTQPGHLAQVGHVVSSKLFPYRDAGWLYRHAIARHLRWLDQLAPVKTIVSQVDAVIEVVREEEMQIDFQNTFTALGETVSKLIGNGMGGRARETLGRVREKLEMMPEGDWKRRYLSEFQQRFGVMMEQG